ncbi:MAG: FAD-binding oxidoreductase [Gammaproteobacteria bacterium]|jgi:FAD/FMN-containing dehydrogenase|nr:hydroxyacid dehydrogenase [Chromatiales bacterium]MDP7296244.1 FAD-binding oxidoreductase [Gammaproteobacteria bacterium]MDP7420098.1 FAD-binding oxidoreductase [Gammaproteobacteria bacterium]MDP7661065.1 FAD-binding oxidoreductase [Gammaproteobacteria bacterium]HJP39936.1 FAD-binding oxidoreductase [Gammaproteobacteria bacterium]
MKADIDPALIQRFASIVGPAGIVTDVAALEPALTEWRGLYAGCTPLLLAPAETAEVAAILALCQSAGIGVVPQGGNTGLVGGAIPASTPHRPEILLSARRMSSIREIDPVNYTITVEAGCILADLQNAAADADRFFPLSLAAEGSCQIGGNIATNAGGTNVLRYGNTRDLVMGLEVVLADGRIFNGLRGLRKDNAGYDLKQLFIGAEGTLGFITAATCKLFPRPRSVATAWAAVTDPEAAIRLNSEARRLLGDQLIALELINRLAVDLVLEHIPASRNPLNEPSDWVLLLELGSAGSGAAADTALEAFLARALDEGLVTDVMLAQNISQRDELWHIRHNISAAQKIAGAGIKHDISVPVSRLGEFLQSAHQYATERVPGIKVVAFGHLGDGNLHFNLNQPDNMRPDQFTGLWTEISTAIHTLVAELGGSFSAEHGVGALKSDELVRLRGGVELALMKQIKAALDPTGIMNPGKVLSSR